MRKLRQLTPNEVLFIGGETDRVYQHTAGLVIVDGSDVPGYGFEAFRHHMETHILQIPHFRWKLHEVPLGLDLPYWVEDENFDLEHHIRRVAVPSPGDDRALAEVVSYLYCRHLDRQRPLWEIWFIEGLADGRYAFLQKLHHCTMDGEGASRLTEAMWDFEPDAPPRKIPPELADARPGEVPERWRQALNTAVHLSGTPLRIGREIVDAVRQDLSRRFRDNGRPKEKPAAPGTPFNRDITGDRALVFGSLPLADIKAVKDHFGVTVNDVILAIVSGSLREYLVVQDALPDDSLRTSIAVSLRTEADDEFSNRVTVASVTLATDLTDPLARLKAICTDTVRAKEEAHHGARGFMEFMQLFPPLVVNVLMHVTPAEQVPRMAGVNLVVSNVRGSDRPMYVGGARAEAVYPMSIISPGGGLNVTCLSYAGQIHFGLTIEPSLVPDPWRLIDGLHDTLETYKSLAGKPARSRKRAAARAAAVSRKQPAKARKKPATRRRKPAPKRPLTRKK
jgi:WS/DGAT/MGAT family acyltransferase